MLGDRIEYRRNSARGRGDLVTVLQCVVTEEDALRWRGFLDVPGLLLGVVWTGGAALAQDWPDIPAAELAVDRAPRGLHLNAVLLYRSLTFDDQKRTADEHLRIKILTDEGRDHGNVEIPFLKGATEVADIRARTVQPDGRTVPFSGIVYEKTVVRAQKLRYLAKTLTLPDVRAGSIVEYRYTIRRKEIGIAEWRIQSPIYTMHAHFSIKAAKFDAYLDFPILRWNAFHVKQGTRPKPLPEGGYSLDLDDIPALESEDFALPDSELTSRFEFYYLSSRLDGELFWAETMKGWSREVESFLGNPKALADAAASISQESDTDDQKLRRIYSRVQRLRNLTNEIPLSSKQAKREDIRPNKNAPDVWKRGYGTGRDIDLLFVALARAAGFDADLVVYAGRNRGFFHRNLPSAEQINGYLAVVTLKTPTGGAEDIFLDPAVPTLRYGMLDWDSTGVSAIRLHGGSGSFIEIPSRPEWGGKIERKGTLDLDPSGKLAGSVVVSFTGQEALWKRKQAKEQHLDETRNRDDLEDAVKEWLGDSAHIELVKTAGWDDTAESLVAEFRVEMPDFAVSTARRLIAPTTIFHTHRRLREALQHGSRVSPFYFPYPSREDDEITIRLPEGVEVEGLPDRAIVDIKSARYETFFESHAGALQIRRVLELNETLYSNIGALREFFDSVRDGDENRILLRRSSGNGR